MSLVLIDAALKYFECNNVAIMRSKYSTIATTSVVSVTLIAMTMIPAVYFRPANAVEMPSDGEVNDCESTDLDQVADSNGNTYLVWNCPNHDLIQYAAFSDDATERDEIQTLATGVDEPDVAISLYDGGAKPMPLAVVDGELKSYVCDPDCIETAESPDNPNPPPPIQSLTVAKVVINDDGGTNSSSDFTITVSGSNVQCTSTDNDCTEGEEGSEVTFTGSEAGTTVTMDPGDYFITEEENADYDLSYSGDCQADVDDSSLGRGTLDAGETEECTMTNDDEEPIIIGSFSFSPQITSVSATATPYVSSLSLDENAKPQIMPVHKWTALVGEETGAQHPVAASGPGDNIVYAAWEDDGEGDNKDIFFNVGTVEDTNGDGADDYIDWEHDPPLNLSESSSESLSPRIAVSGTFANPGNNVYVTWEEGGDVKFKRSTNTGESFGSTVNLSNTSTPSVEHEIATDGSNVYVVFADSIRSDQRDIWLKVSTNGGSSFASIKRIEATDFDSFEPDIAAKTIGGKKVVDIVWEDSRFEDQTKRTEAMFAQSTDGGKRFSPPMDVSDTVGFSKKVLVSIAGDNSIFVAWKDNTEDPGSDEYRIYAVMSTNAGRSFTDAAVYGDAKSLDSPLDLDGKVCAWDIHCRYCQSTDGYYEDNDQLASGGKSGPAGWFSWLLRQ